MTIRTRILVAYLAMLAIPLLLLVGIDRVLRSYHQGDTVRILRGLQPRTPFARVARDMGVATRLINLQILRDPDLLASATFMRTLDPPIHDLGFVVRRGDEVVYLSPVLQGVALPALPGFEAQPQAARPPERRAGPPSERAVMSQWDFRFSDGTPGSLFLLRGAEPRPPDGPLSPRLFASSPEPLEELPPIRQGIPWGRLIGVVVVIGIAAVGFLAISGGWFRGLDLEGMLRAVAPLPGTAPPETATAVVEATAPLAPGPSPTSPPTEPPPLPSGTPNALADCLSWEQITVANEGQTVCAYGVVSGRSVTADFPILIYFSSEPGAFIIVDRTAQHPEVDPGVCVMVIGEVEVMGRVRPVIDAQGEILFCQ